VKRGKDFPQTEEWNDAQPGGFTSDEYSCLKRCVLTYTQWVSITEAKKNKLTCNAQNQSIKTNLLEFGRVRKYNSAYSDKI
jgi:hypothetical protein